MNLSCVNKEFNIVYNSDELWINLLRKEGISGDYGKNPKQTYIDLRSQVSVRLSAFCSAPYAISNVEKIIVNASNGNQFDTFFAEGNRMNLLKDETLFKILKKDLPLTFKYSLSSTYGTTYGHDVNYWDGICDRPVKGSLKFSDFRNKKGALLTSVRIQLSSPKKAAVKFGYH